MTRAIILAAGTGSRLGNRTARLPKCLIDLVGQPLLEWQLRALRGAGIDDVTIVTGFEAQQLDAFAVATVHNPRYAETNMVASLMCGRDVFDGHDDVVIAYGDIVYESRLVELLVEPAAPITVVVDRQWRALWEQRMDDPLADAETLRIDSRGRLLEIGKVATDYAQIEAQYVGMIGVKADFALEFVATHDSLDADATYDGRHKDQMYMTSLLQHFIDSGIDVAATLTDAGWLEVDTEHDLAAYETLHEQGRLAQFVRLVGA